MRWTTNQGLNTLYDSLNNYGDNEWISVFEMDCSKTADDDGWFAFKTKVVQDGVVVEEESGQDVQGMCGTLDQEAPFSANGVHYAKCGAFNKFAFDYPSCEVDEAHWSLTDSAIKK